VNFGAGGGGGGGFGGGGGGGRVDGGGGGGGGGSVGGAGGTGGGGGGAGLGGGIFSNQGTITLTNDTFTANTATGGSVGGSGATAGQALGGAVFARNGSLTATFDTFSRNTVTNGDASAGTASDVYVLSDGSDGGNNTSPGSGTATVTLNNSILGQSGTTTVADFVATTNGGAGPTMSGANNLISSNPTAANGGFTGGVIAATDPMLGPLAHNGGPTETMALPASSPAHNAGVGSAAFPTDQRGSPRPTSGPVDIGAFEIPFVGLPAGTIDVLSPTANGALNLSGNAQLAIPGVLTVDSSSANAITASGKASDTATVINVVGGVQTSGNASLSPTPHTGATAVADPFAGLAAPSFSGTGTAVHVSGNQTLPLAPGTYSQITVSGNGKLTLTGGGTYVITTGGFQVSGNASVSMSGSGGVLIYDAGGGIAVSGNATLNLSALTTGPDAGLVIFQARTNTRALNFSGNGVAGLSGTVYAAGAQVILSGNASLQHVSLVVNTLTLSGNAGAFQLTDGSSSDYLASTSNQILVGALTVAVVDDTGNGIDPNEQARLSDAMTYLNQALGGFGVNLTWAPAGTVADVTIHLASSTPEGGASAGVLGFTTGSDDVYLVTTGWNFYTGSDPTQIGSGQYDFQTLAEHELAHAVGLGESSDPQSVMYEYLSAGAVRRTFTDSNLSLINTDADRFMKAGPQPASSLTVAAGAAGVNLGPATAVPESDLIPVSLAVTSLPGQLPPWGNGLPVAAASCPLAAPPMVDPLRVAFPLTEQETAGQGSNGPDVLVGGEGNGVVLGGQARDVLVGSGPTGAVRDCYPVSRGDSLDAHGAALRQVASEWSAVGSLGGLDDLTTEALCAPPRCDEGRGGLDLGGTTLTESDGGDERGRLAAADLWGAGLAVALVEWMRLDGAEPSADLERRPHRARTVS
jgi:hypothetical protein